MIIKAVGRCPRDRALGKSLPRYALSRGGHEQRRCITSQGVLVRPSRKVSSFTEGNALPADEMGGWVDCSHLDALVLLDRTGACPERSRRVQGTSHRGDCLPAEALAEVGAGLRRTGGCALTLLVTRE